ncbi:MAG: hypothetical protein ABI999_16520 [Acidobacteriota bacterium]
MKKAIELLAKSKFVKDGDASEPQASANDFNRSKRKLEVFSYWLEKYRDLLYY